MRRGHGADRHTPDLFETQATKVEQFADEFATALRRAAEQAKKEEDIRVAVERQLERLAAEYNVHIEGKHEYTLLRGAVDSVYGSVFVEYKNPADGAAQLGPSLSSPGTRKVVEQIDRRFADVASVIGRTGAAMVGIGCDGRYFVFRRFVGGQITGEEPVEISRWSGRRFLFALLNLGSRGLALTPEYLADDFGSTSDRAAKGVAAFAEAITDHGEEPRVRTFFQQWKILFGEVCGYDLTDPRGQLRVLCEAFGRKRDEPIYVLFALHTYYALFMKLLAAHVVTYFQTIGRSPLGDIERAGTSEVLRERIRELEDGDVYRHLGLTNFLEGDLFSWYLSAWTDGIEECIRSFAARLLEYNPTSLRDNPQQARDLLKKLYQQLVPSRIRHDLGEYYTPDWLAEQTMDSSGYDGDPSTRLLDPACGSGTFLVLALARVRGWLERNFEQAGTPQDVGRAAARNIQGFDLNPLAVLAARTNFVIQFFDLFDYRGTLEVPIYLCDSVLTPSEYGGESDGELWDKPVPVPTSAKRFLVPREVTRDRETLGKYCNVLAEFSRTESGFSGDDFIARCRRQGILISDKVRDQHWQLFSDIRTLDKDRRNGVWARFIKNAFAPVFLRNDPVDLVVGNPPWVNWQSLPGRMEADIEEGERPNYRQQIAEVFKRYGLFSLSGTAGRLGGGKKDLSMLFAYACADHYLKEGGTLGFVITQTVFKTKGAGDGFRQFEYAVKDKGGRKRSVYLRVKSVEDLSDFQPFEGATNRTAIFVCEKSERKTRYPVPYTVWTKTRRGRIEPDEPLGEVHEAVRREKLGAVPVQKEKPTSPWLTAPRAALSAMGKIIGRSAYQAHAGACTWLNGVYWIRVLQDVPEGALIENLWDVGKIKVKRVRYAIEPDLLYPLLRGRDVRRWRAAPSAHLILAQDPRTRAGIPEAEMRRRWPKTYTYLKKFEEQLRQRSGFRKYFDPSDPFYSMYNVGPYTMAPWKVVWSGQVAPRLRAAVIDGRDRDETIVPDQTCYFCSFEEAIPAHELCAILNSAPVRLWYKSVAYKHTSMGFVGQLQIPAPGLTPRLAKRLAALSEKAHVASLNGEQRKLGEIESAIDECAAELWGLSSRESSGIREALKRDDDTGEETSQRQLEIEGD